jgi:hypothetical protein
LAGINGAGYIEAGAEKSFFELTIYPAFRSKCLARKVSKIFNSSLAKDVNQFCPGMKFNIRGNKLMRDCVGNIEGGGHVFLEGARRRL